MKENPNLSLMTCIIFWAIFFLLCVIPSLDYKVGLNHRLMVKKEYKAPWCSITQACICKNTLPT